MTREGILKTAIHQFGRMGFEGASTRDIARAAGTAMSSITYHFGGKEGLYLACADHIAQQVSTLQADALALMDGDMGALDKGEIKARLLAIMDRMAEIMIDPVSEDWSSFIVREQQQPTEAFDRLYNGAMGPLIEGGTRMLAALRPDLADAEVRANAMLAFGQALVLRAARASVCRALGTDTLGDKESALLRAQLRTNLLSLLNTEPDQ